MRIITTIAVAFAVFEASTAFAATTTILTSSAFATSAWGNSAPYRRDSWLGDALGISNSDPYGMAEYAASPEGGGQLWQQEISAWAETTYLVFDSSAFAGADSVSSAFLSVTTVARAGAPEDISSGMSVAAHQVLADPTNILTASSNPADPAYAAGADYENSYGYFQTYSIGSIVGTFVHSSDFGVYQIDLTSLVNEWLADPQAPGAFALALTGQVAGNDANAWVGIRPASHEGAPSLTFTAIPEAGTAALLGLSGAGLLRRRRRALV